MKKPRFLLPLLFAGSALAAENSRTFTLSGELYETNGTAPLIETVTLTIGIHSPDGLCLLYQEQQGGIDLSQTSGAFSVQVGSGVGSAKRTGSDPGLTMAKIFANGSTAIRAAGAANCASGYVPVAGDGRKLRLTVQYGSTTITLSPDQEISSVPQATVAETIQGLTPRELLQVTNNATSYIVDKSALDTLFGTAGLVDASSLHSHDSLYAQSGTAASFTSVYLSSGSFLRLGSHAAAPGGLTVGDAGKTWFDSTTGRIKYWDGTAAKELGTADSRVSSITGGTGLTGGTITSSGTLAVDVGTTANKVVQLDASAKLPAVDGSALTSLNATNISSGTINASRLPSASATTAGALSFTDWQTFNGAATAASAATNANTADTIVKRDASGNFSAGTITANLTGNVAGSVTGSASQNVLKAGDTMSGSLTVNATSMTTPGLTVKGLSGQTAHLLEARDSASTVKAAIAPDGVVKANGFSYMTAQSRVLRIVGSTCANSDFVTISALPFECPSTLPQSVVWSLNLPQGASILGLSFVGSSSVGGAAITCSLMKGTSSDNAVNLGSAALAATVTTAESPEQTSFSSATIDNESHAYAISCSATGAATYKYIGSLKIRYSVASP